MKNQTAKVNLCARVPFELKSQLESIAIDGGTSVSQLILEYVRKGLQQDGHNRDVVDLSDESIQEIRHQLLLGIKNGDESTDLQDIELDDFTEDEGSAFPALPEHEALETAIRYLEKSGKSIPIEYLADVCILYALKNRFLLGDSIDRFLDGKGLAQIDVQTLDEWRQEVLKKFK